MGVRMHLPYRKEGRRSEAVHRHEHVERIAGKDTTSVIFFKRGISVYSDIIAI